MHLMMASKSPASSSTSSPLLDARTVKKEVPDDEIKDFAETAMNELLGWYGYDSRGGRALLGRKGPSPPAAAQAQAKSPKTPDENDDCAWCNNPITPDSNPLNQSIGDKFCSELCFSQSRRATFKRAKTCDWCRHIRHTVSYVDFQDGATQLQFCSDKCLNQYKMHIFCRETQAHLDLNPHLVNATTSNTNLITPDLWLKNCRSRSVSPTSEHSASPNGDKASPEHVSPPAKNNINISPDIIITPTTQNNPKPPSSHPMITVAPTSKLMRPKMPSVDERIKMQLTPEMRREHRIMKTNSKRRRNSRCSSTVTSQNVSKHNASSTMIKPQDLTIRSPSLSQESSPNSASLLHTPQNMLPSPPITLNPRIPNMHPSNFPNPLLNFQQPPHTNPGQNSFPNPGMMRPPFFPQHSYFPRPFYQNDQHRHPIPPSLQQLGLGPPPPLTVLVPYPIILPIPLPIPIPIPIMNFVKAYETKKWPNETQTHPKQGTNQSSTSEEPLDFTMHKSRKDSEDLNNDTIPEMIEIEAPETSEKIQQDENENISVTENSSNNEFSGHLESVDSSNPEQTLPRFKITRLGAKMSKIVMPKTKEPLESTRPLRKRRRLVEVASEDECNTVVNKTRKQVHA